MPRRHKNARKRENPRKLRVKEHKIRVKQYQCPEYKKGDIYAGRVVAVAEYEKIEKF